MSNPLKRLLRTEAKVEPTSYWEARYRDGGTSGSGSYGRLADYKAEFLNGLVADEGISSVLELGCGDGNQLSLATYPRYLGLDVSPTAVELCTSRFADDPTRSFLWFEPNHLADPAGFIRADLTMSLDVLYHLIDPSALARHLELLFGLSERLVVIYAGSPRRRDALVDAAHVVHQDFETWIDSNAHGWELRSHHPNPYPFDPASPDDTSFSDFFVYQRT